MYFKTNMMSIEKFLNNLNYKLFLIDDFKLKIREVSNLEPYFDTNGQLIHNLINRLAVDSSK